MIGGIGQSVIKSFPFAYESEVINSNHSLLVRFKPLHQFSKIVFKVLTRWMIFKIETIVVVIIPICVKINVHHIACGYLVGWKWISTIFSNHWDWRIICTFWSTIINGQKIRAKIALFKIVKKNINSKMDLTCSLNHPQCQNWWSWFQSHGH